MSIRGRTFVFTGKMSRTRVEMERLTREAGAYVGSKVDYGVNYVVVGKRVGNTKLNGAVDKRVPFITENEFWRIYHGQRETPRTISREQVLAFTHDELFNENTLYNGDRAAPTPIRSTPAPAPAAPQRPAAEGFSISDFFED